MRAAEPSMSKQRLRLRDAGLGAAREPRFRGARDSVGELIMISDCSSEITMTCLHAPQQITLLTLPDLTLGLEAASPGDRRSLQTLSCACGGRANTCGSAPGVSVGQT